VRWLNIVGETASLICGQVKEETNGLITFGASLSPGRRAGLSLFDHK
jgi:hypothetical protein